MPDVAAPLVGASTHHRSADRTLIAVALAAAAILGAIAALPSWGPGEATVVAHALAAALIVVGVVVRRPARVVPWVLVAVGCAVQAVAASVLVVGTRTAGSIGPGVAAAIAALAYPALFVGVAGITTRREASRLTDPWWAVVAMITGSGVVLLSLTLPTTLRSTTPWTEAEWGGVLGAADLVLAAVAVSRTLGRGGRVWSAWLLAAGFVAWGNGHAEIGARLDAGMYDDGPAVTLLVVVGSLLLGLAAIVPSMDAALDARRVHDRRWARTTNTARVLALPPLLLAVLHVVEVDAGRLWIVVPAAAVIGAAACRVATHAARLDQPERDLSPLRPGQAKHTVDSRMAATPSHVGLAR